MFVLSKLLGFLALPSNFLMVLALCGVGLLGTRWRRAGSAVLAASAVALALCGFSPLGNVLLLTLSERFPQWQDDGRAPDGIIVLGGSIDSEASDARGAIELDSSAERVVAMLDLARRYPQATIVFSGGSGNLIQNSVAEAPFARQLLARAGVSDARIVLEDRSRTTAENATLTRALIAPKPGERWLLVTSAFHMPRAIGAFRHVGFEVEAYPVDWRTRGWRDAVLPFDRLSSGLARCDVAMHEWTGLVSYWLAGRSSELLPGPRQSGVGSPRR